jgi:hypothetical protein
MFMIVFPFCLQGAQLRKHIDATLGSGNLREAVRLPPGEDINEWLAVNSNFVVFFSLLECIDCISMILGLVLNYVAASRMLLEPSCFIRANNVCFAFQLWISLTKLIFCMAHLQNSAHQRAARQWLQAQSMPIRKSHCLDLSQEVLFFIQSKHFSVKSVWLHFNLWNTVSTLAWLVSSSVLSSFSLNVMNCFLFIFTSFTLHEKLGARR